MSAAGDVARRGPPTITGNRIPLGYETLVLADDNVHTLQHVPVPVDYGRAEYAIVRVRCPTNTAAGGVAWRDDGVDPTVTDGMPSEHGTEETYPGDPAKLRFVRLTADTVTLHIAYYY